MFGIDERSKKVMPNLGTPELIIVLVIVLLIFGVGRVSRIGSELGQGIREFRKGLSEGTEDNKEDEKENKE
jgi:sec-independent protein translocase protein TatA